MMIHSLTIWLALIILIEYPRTSRAEVNSILHRVKLDMFKRALFSISTALSVPLSGNQNPNLQAVKTGQTTNRKTGNKVSNLILCCGYLIEASQYQHYAQSLHPQYLLTVPSPTTNSSSILDDANLILRNAQTMLDISAHKAESKTCVDLLIIGHSRGAAAAAAAFSSLTQSQSNQQLHLRLVLLDPVDTIDLEVLRFMEENLSHSSASSSLSSNNFDHRILIVSTPFGGRSKYYKTTFTSACAPFGRNADSFFTALRNLYTHVSFVTLPQFGHLQFLGDRASSRFVDTCASSLDETKDSLSDSDLIHYTQALLQEWLQVRDLTAVLPDELSTRLSLEFPRIEQKWSEGRVD